MLCTAVRSRVSSTLSLSVRCGPRAVAVMHVSNRRLDREEGKAQRDERRRKSVNQRHVHGRYFNLMRRPFKAVTPGVCLLTLTVLFGANACQRDAERAGEPVAHRRLGVDTTTPPHALTHSMLRLGDSVWHGWTGQAQCSRCHAGHTTGTPAAPEIMRSEWLRAASYGALVHFLAHGQQDGRGEDAAKPHPGAARLSAAELRAVALYVRWLAGGRHSPASGTGR